MAITVQQTWHGAEINADGGAASADIRSEYVIMGTADEIVAAASLEAAVADTLGGLVKTQVRITERMADFAWKGEVRWASTARRESEEKIIQTDGSSFSFETSGGTQHITQSLATTRYAPAGETAPDYQGAIGVTKNSVEGVDITIPVYNFSETYHQATVNKPLIFSMTGKVNNASFEGFSAGEVLFLGASGGKRNLDLWEVTYNFAASPNVSGLSIGGITGIDKQGWEYLWIAYQDQTDDSARAIVRRPLAVYVEQTYGTADLNDLFD